MCLSVWIIHVYEAMLWLITIIFNPIFIIYFKIFYGISWIHFNRGINVIRAAFCTYSIYQYQCTHAQYENSLNIAPKLKYILFAFSPLTLSIAVSTGPWIVCVQTVIVCVFLNNIFLVHSMVCLYPLVYFYPHICPPCTMWMNCIWWLINSFRSLAEQFPHRVHMNDCAHR